MKISPDGSYNSGEYKHDTRINRTAVCIFNKTDLRTLASRFRMVVNDMYFRFVVSRHDRICHTNQGKSNQASTSEDRNKILIWTVYISESAHLGDLVRFLSHASADMARGSGDGIEGKRKWYSDIWLEINLPE